MKFYIDGEWNGYGGELLSLALCAEDGAEWYKEFYITEDICEWVNENVIPKMSGEQTSWDVAQLSLQRFLSEYDSVHIVADWPEDIAHFCHFLIVGPGKRIATPPLTFEIVRIEASSLNPHNALADARGIRLAMMGRESAPPHEGEERGGD